MWNYGDIDRYITLEHLSLIMKWFDERNTDKQMMVSEIIRNGNEYKLKMTDAGSGYGLLFRIENEQVVALGTSGFWMS